eukprot:4254049-Prymnesium_polylepis.1
MLHGFLVVDSRSGVLIYSQRFSPAFGLTAFDQLGENGRSTKWRWCSCSRDVLATCPSNTLILRIHLPARCQTAAKDEIRLGAMLYALHLHAASVVDSEGGALTHFRVGDAALHFCCDAARQLLFILSSPAPAGEEAPARLAAQLLERFAACHPGGPVAMPRASLKQAFAPALREAVDALPGWLLQQLVRSAAPAQGSTAGIDGAAAAAVEVPFGSPAGGVLAAASAAAAAASARPISAA